MSNEHPEGTPRSQVSKSSRRSADFNRMLAYYASILASTTPTVFLLAVNLPGGEVEAQSFSTFVIFPHPTVRPRVDYFEIKLGQVDYAMVGPCT
jgi:hypothetical protein